jgi:hypothetical protein
VSKRKKAVVESIDIVQADPNHTKLMVVLHNQVALQYPEMEIHYLVIAVKGRSTKTGKLILNYQFPGVLSDDDEEFSDLLALIEASVPELRATRKIQRPSASKARVQ